MRFVPELIRRVALGSELDHEVGFAGLEALLPILGGIAIDLEAEIGRELRCDRIKRGGAGGTDEIDRDLFLWIFAKGSAEGHGHDEGKAIDPKHGSGLAIEDAHARKGELRRWEE